MCYGPGILQEEATELTEEARKCAWKVASGEGQVESPESLGVKMGVRFSRI
jgi:hypothetical protein